METYERMYWDASSDLAAATARQNELVSAQRVKVFDKIFPAFPEMLREKKELISSYEGNVPLDIQEQFSEKYKDLFAQTDAFWDELRELSDVLPELRAKDAERKEKEEKEKQAAWKRDAYNGFLANDSLMNAKRKAQVLDKQFRFAEFGVLTRAELIEAYWSNGALKPKKDEYTKEIEKGHWSSRIYTKKHCVEYYVNDWEMPKIAYDYAVYLSNIQK